MHPKEQKITFSDKILRATFLKFFPRKVTPNQLTIARMISVPFVAFFIFTNQMLIAVILFASFAFTDALDGAMARTRSQITEWGKIHDPLADKLLIGLTAILIIPKYLSPSIAVVIIFIEMILIGSTYYLKNKGFAKIRANAWGKAKMITQSIGVGLLFLFALVNLPLLLTLAEIILYASIVLALISLITYSI